MVMMLKKLKVMMKLGFSMNTYSMTFVLNELPVYSL